jgi:hypothetical protein
MMACEISLTYSLVVIITYSSCVLNMLLENICCCSCPFVEAVAVVAVVVGVGPLSMSLRVVDSRRRGLEDWLL